MNPPVVATLFATAAGLIWSQAPQDLQSNEVLHQVLEPLQVAFRYAGRCTVPMILFCLGARLTDAVIEVKESLRRLGYSLPHSHGTNGANDNENVDSLPAKPAPISLGMPEDS